MKIIKRFSILLITIIIIALLAFNVYNYFCINILGQDLATINGYAVLEVVSGSMEPTIHIGDLIVIDTKYQDYKNGDIVTFYDVDNSFVTHRIVSIDEEKMITKGDANNTEDEALNIKRIVGVYVTKLNGLGKIITSFKSPFVMGMIFLIGLMVCFLVSTDKSGNPILTEEEKEFLKFKEEQTRNAKKAREKK